MLRTVLLLTGALAALSADDAATQAPTGVRVPACGFHLDVLLNFS